ncbi:DUF523 domain-containing protein [Clostridium botulinum]|uniref:CD3072 family TudS-related putative desulfidase n=1 Tax=Clostridium botulinum TaxID=1491 RepID=UPI00016B9F32|nr:CD3072 family TudS-related putative desulfidase [Clostridium botulinum]EDT86254.1 conserved hypothetical protein [Clostridium botulinum Bf]MBY6756753.1 DUF523 domain-containing protein [Clostridium botulinum]MBY6881565.1 DUF523 domain-containing protein [Clostridium botulinum]NEZ87202.1 DUF523 domain-containing protein [Clostridium botulinum]NFB01510.1 DUF523 domain-containing protein [Clostridium botulinum]
MEKEKIIFLSHCMLNKSSKVKYYGEEKNREKDEKIRKFLKLLMDNNISIIQLPCPEITYYGVKRWGHVKDQFDTTHFRKHCRQLFSIYLEQIEEYINNGYEILGIVGIEGSPTCGVNKTCVGKWGGELSSNNDLQSIIGTIKRVNERGIFMEEIKKVLEEKQLNINIIGLDETNIENIYKLFL